MKIIEPNSSAEFEQYYALRYEVLRKPWLQPKGSEKDDGDKSSIHRMIINEESGEAVAVGRLHFNSDEEAQIRYMAVSDKYQLKGYGNIIVKALEDIALKKKCKNIILQARENALKFYSKNGYEIIEKSYLLFDEIQHWLMEKELTTD
ncbi:MAG: GNAT family N-acetyltransferase [Candidatus Marinimicrobia bacterium]|nr:GNAT family N-acetyltransferase [Candidatus Neomarinimicrobiota bacterium]